MISRSALYDAVLEHERLVPAHNAFRYRIYQLLLDLDELDELAERDPVPLGRPPQSRGGALRRSPRRSPAVDPRQPPRLARFARRERARRPHRAAHPRAHVRVRLQPGLVLLRAQSRRLAGLRRGRGAQHLRRALALPAGRAGELDPDGRMRFSTEKRFHVSPFMDVSGTYRFLLAEPGERLMMRIDEEREGERFFRAVLTGERRPLTSAALAHALVRYPWVTGQVMARIHWQALRLWAQTRAVPPQAPLRPRARIDADMSRAEREGVLAARRAPGLVGAVSRRVLERALSGIENGALELRAPDGARHFGDPDAVPVVMEVHDPRFFARLARSGRLAVGEGYQAGEWSSPDLPGPRRAARAQPGSGLRAAAVVGARGARAVHPAHRAATRAAPRRARRARALRPRQRVLLALAGRLDDVLLRALRFAGLDPRRSAAGEVPRARRGHAHRAGRPRARDRERLGRLRDPPRARARMPRHDGDDLPPAARAGDTSACARRG